MIFSQAIMTILLFFHFSVISFICRLNRRQVAIGTLIFVFVFGEINYSPQTIVLLCCFGYFTATAAIISSLLFVTAATGFGLINAEELSDILCELQVLLMV